MTWQTEIDTKIIVNELLYGCYGGGFDVLQRWSVFMEKCLYFCRSGNYN